MSDRRFIKPKAGLILRDPTDDVPLPKYGKGVAWDSFWQRRLDAQDIEITDEKAVLAGERAAQAETVKGAGEKGDGK